MGHPLVVYLSPESPESWWRLPLFLFNVTDASTGMRRERISKKAGDQNMGLVWGGQKREEDSNIPRAYGCAVRGVNMSQDHLWVGRNFLQYFEL
jgi:hypothetical protein